MKNKLLVVMIIALALAALAVVFKSNNNVTRHVHNSAASQPKSPDTANTAHQRVPAYQATASSKTLPPTLEPEEFIGKTREAYTVAKAIPATLAQLPCYCHCDEGFGHKSLQTCFVDDHAAHCAVCVDEALLAYKLEREQRQTPAQIRETIIAKYSNH
jgi:Protein of unknown function with PCYCGC motif